MQKFSHLLLGLLLVLSFIGCENDEKGFLPGYSGSFGEVVLVVNNSIWQGDIGDSILVHLGESQYGFPQNEPHFKLIQVATSKFQSVLKTHRSIIQVVINNKLREDEYGLQLKKSKWAKGQLVIELNSRSRDEFLVLLRKEKSNIFRIIEDAELNRIILRNKKFGSKELNSTISELLNLKMNNQKDWEIEKMNQNNVWLRLERERQKGGKMHQVSQGILIHTEPYTSKLQFLDTNLFLFIDSILKQNIPGPGDGQYMQLMHDYIPPISSDVNFKSSFGKEIRGIWRMENNFMGGPFFGLVFLDEGNQRVIYCYGYVYSPKFSKREYLREIEGVIKSIDHSISSKE